jgi:glycosyltransferase involved in cell wall biosynthesis
MVYLAHDLHFVRMRLQAELQGSTHNSSGVLRLIEEQCFRKADLSLVATAEEVSIVEAEFPGAAVRAVNYFVLPEHPLPTGLPASFQAAFVGGPLHEPNFDGIRWFLSQVWPGVAGGQLVIHGAWEHEAPRFADVTGVRFTGALSDAELDESLAAASVGIAPLRFGAGMKRKTLHYLSLGLPVVGTEFAVEGLADGAGHTPGVTVATTPKEWLAAFTLLSDPDFWASQSLAGWSFVRERFSASRYREVLSSALDELQ